MADDNTLRSYRSNDPYRRKAEHVDAQADDPLAELVRLIGQPDPFTDNAPRNPQRAQPRAPQARRDQPRERTADSAGGWRQHVQRPNFETRDEPNFDADPRHDSFDADPRHGSAESYGAPRHAPPPSFTTDHDPYRIASQQSDSRYADPRYDDPRYGHSHDDYGRESSYSVPTQYREEPMFDTELRYGEAQRGRQRANAGPGVDEDYDDPPRRKGGSSLVTAAVLIGCAMLGTAGAYSYRTYISGSGSTQAPVIIADTSPNKVVPTERKSTRSQDRVGGQGGDEKLVSREEQPVNLQTPGNAVPRVVFPSPVQSTQQAPPTSTGSTPPPRSSNAQANQPGGSTDQPKTVRTLTIRPDGGGPTNGQPFGDVPARNAAPPAARSAFPPPPAARASREEPLSLNPSSAPAQVNQPRQQPRGREAAPSEPRLASIPPTSGGYMVQISSQRSESDAQASFRALQEKYSQLRSRELVVRRADLGSRGIYYRAMVGPFGSSEEANQFCNSLKQSGGQCIIQRN